MVAPDRPVPTAALVLVYGGEVCRPLEPPPLATAPPPDTYLAVEQQEGRGVGAQQEPVQVRPLTGRQPRRHGDKLRTALRAGGPARPHAQLQLNTHRRARRGSIEEHGGSQ